MGFGAGRAALRAESRRESRLVELMWPAPLGYVSVKLTPYGAASWMLLESFQQQESNGLETTTYRESMLPIMAELRSRLHNGADLFV